LKEFEACEKLSTIQNLRNQYFALLSLLTMQNRKSHTRSNITLQNKIILIKWVISQDRCKIYSFSLSRKVLSNLLTINSSSLLTLLNNLIIRLNFTSTIFRKSPISQLLKSQSQFQMLMTILNHQYESTKCQNYMRNSNLRCMFFEILEKFLKRKNGKKKNWARMKFKVLQLSLLFLLLQRNLKKKS